MKTHYDQNQLDVIDVLIGNILDAREAGDDDDLCMYSKQLTSFLADANARQFKRGSDLLDRAALGTPFKLEPEPDPETRWIVLEGWTGRKLDVIKNLRACTDLGLREAKTVVDSAPIGLSREIHPFTDGLAEILGDAGAVVRITADKPQRIATELSHYFEAKLDNSREDHDRH